MSPWLAGAIVLLAVGLPAAGWIASRGAPVDRLVGVEMGTVIVTLELILFAQAVGQSSYLIVPLVLAVVSFAGTLVYARLLAPRS
ncbi:MAG TPA: MrpF/PhaF family protein [Streptosporangiaceae bacterium]